MVTRNQHLSQHMNWFDRQFLRAQDFADESDYHIDRRRRHLRTLHTPGVAEGMIVRGLPGDASVTVDPGTAIDDLGHDIVLLTTPSPLALPSVTAAELYVSYAEAETDQSPDPGITGYTRVTETPAFSFREIAPGSAPVPADGVLLAQLAINAGLLGDQPDNTVRVGAGAAVGDIAAFSVTLKRVGQPSTAWPRITASGPNQLSVAGDLRVTGQGDVAGALSVLGPLTAGNGVQFTAQPGMASPSLTASGPNQLSLSGDLRVTGQGNVAGALSVLGPLTAGNGVQFTAQPGMASPSLTASGPNQLSLSGDLRVTGQGNVAGALSVLGPLTLGNGVQFGAGAPITAVSRDTSLSAASDAAVPTERAVKTYADSIRSYVDKHLGIQIGLTSVNNSSAGTYIRTCSFQTPFAAPPQIFLAMTHGDVQPPRYDLSAQNVTNTQFNLQCYVWDSSYIWQINIAWLAFGPLA